jgi:hypothetical protein
MKSLKSYIAIIVVMILFCANSTAQAKTVNDVPSAVANAFKTKYPNATVKNWDLADNIYTAKAKDEHGKYYASFDNNGNWVNTTIKYNWPGHLTPAVKKAFRNSEYSGWHIYGVNVIESPSGQSYQVLVDDANHKINSNHQELFTLDHLLEYKANGELMQDKSLN